DPQALAPQLAYLRDHHLAAADLRARPLRPVPAISASYDPKAILQSLPPLLKGYLRAGASIGEGAVVDQQFNTTDVLVVLRTDAIAARYSRRYEAATARAA
ncbi:MAG TPA: hemolysin-like protein, partial [Rhodospirillaceae bacterium]|nr:hemolysin-like protein [Rhodospirillaceae bacterium]